MEFALNRHALVADDSYPTRTGRSLFILIAYIALGGIFGTLARYLVQGMIQTRSGAFPSGTLAINIAGSLLLGFIVRFATGSTVVSPELRGGRSEERRVGKECGTARSRERARKKT